MDEYNPIAGWFRKYLQRFLAPQRRARAAETRRLEGMDLPNAGRSSVESTLADQFGSALTYWGSVSPVIDFEMLALLKA
jgi:hypothetical protein